MAACSALASSVDTTKARRGGTAPRTPRRASGGLRLPRWLWRWGGCRRRRSSARRRRPSPRLRVGVGVGVGVGGQVRRFALGFPGRDSSMTSQGDARPRRAARTACSKRLAVGIGWSGACACDGAPGSPSLSGARPRPTPVRDRRSALPRRPPPAHPAMRPGTRHGLPSPTTVAAWYPFRVSTYRVHERGQGVLGTPARGVEGGSGAPTWYR